MGDLNHARHWTAQLKSVQDVAAELASAPRVTEIVSASIPDTVQMVSDSIPDTAKMVLDSVPDATSFRGSAPGITQVVGTIPDATKTLGGAALDAASISGSVPDASKMLGGSVLDATLISDSTPDASKMKVQSASAALTNLGVASKSPIYGGTFYSAKQKPATVIPRSLLPRESRESSSLRQPLTDDRIPEQVPQVSPQDLGEELAPNVTRRHRQESKGLLSALDLDLALENLESAERRLLEGGRPERVQAALSASLLLTELADTLFPARKENCVDLYGVSREVGVENVKNRLLAFADSYFENRPKEEHKLLVAELDFIYRWTAAGHHVPFSRTENEEAYCALLKALAIIARARRHSI